MGAPLKNRAACAALVVAWVMVGCESRKTTDGPPPPPPPQTPEDVAREIDVHVRPLFDFVTTAKRQTPVPPELEQPILEKLREAQKTYGQEQIGKEGIRIVVRKLEDHMKVAREVQNGALTLLFCDCIRVFEPNNSRLPRYEEWARIEKNRPVVYLRGWYEPEDTEEEIIYAFVEVYLPENGEVEHLRVRPGDEFLGLRFEKILGDNRGMELTYLATGDKFEVYSRRWLELQEATAPEA